MIFAPQLGQNFIKSSSLPPHSEQNDEALAGSHEPEPHPVLHHSTVLQGRKSS